VSGEELSGRERQLRELLVRVRVNAVALVDSFDWSDSNLCSSLGVYNGQAYQSLFEFAQSSLFNASDSSAATTVVHKYLKPYVQRQREQLTRSASASSKL
jgi:acyl-CoA oxidase